MCLEEFLEVGREPLPSLQRAVEFDNDLGDHAPHHGLDRHDDALSSERLRDGDGEGLRQSWRALSGALDAAAAGLRQCLQQSRASSGRCAAPAEQAPATAGYAAAWRVDTA